MEPVLGLSMAENPTECRAVPARAVSAADEKKQIPSKAARLDKQHGIRYTAKH